MTLGGELGFGVHGIVLTAQSQGEPGRCAVKIHDREPAYLRERDVYLRLQHKRLSIIRGFHVPTMRQFDDDYLILEMTIVQRPFVLDFAGAWLDRAPDFSEEVLADWRAEKAEQFGAHWAEVQLILAVLEAHGIFMEDVHPNNIAVGKE
ncbi:MAG: hypothetical protein HYR84_09890 [Planctomycetes bacterium]|nr:hypothetical protein [Planctomycetota bacterium]